MYTCRSEDKYINKNLLAYAYKANLLIQAYTSASGFARPPVRVRPHISGQEANGCFGPVQDSPARALYTRVAYGARDETDANG